MTQLCCHTYIYVRTHARTHARTLTRTHARTHARMHARLNEKCEIQVYQTRFWLGLDQGLAKYVKLAIWVYWTNILILPYTKWKHNSINDIFIIYNNNLLPEPPENSKWWCNIAYRNFRLLFGNSMVVIHTLYCSQIWHLCITYVIMWNGVFTNCDIWLVPSPCGYVTFWPGNAYSFRNTC